MNLFALARSVSFVGILSCLSLVGCRDTSQNPQPYGVGLSSSSGQSLSSSPSSSSQIVYSEGVLDVGKRGFLRNHVKVVGYLPNYSSHPDPSGLPSKKTLSLLTHVLYFNTSLTDTLGNVNLSELRTNLRLRAVRDSAHAVGTKVLLVIGGANVSTSQFGKVAANAEARQRMAEQLVAFAQETGIDGIDIDWEFPNDLVGDNFSFMLKAIKDRMAGTGLQLSIAVHPKHVTYTNLYKPGFCDHVDFINLMSYDLGIPHAPLDAFYDLERWERQTGCPRSKLVLGLPFYGKINNSPKNTMSWSNLIKSGCDFWADQCALTGGHDFNGTATMTTKTKEVVKGNWGGVMFWEMNQDLPITHPYSLLWNLSTVLPME